MKKPSGSPHDLLRGRLFVSVPELAVILECDQRTIRRGCDSGDIPCTKIGVNWRIPAKWVREQAGLPPE